MTDWPWMHQQGHMKARITEETAESVTFDYEHVNDASYRGSTTISKNDFLRLYGSPPIPRRAIETGTAETERLGPKAESAVTQSGTPQKGVS